MAEDQTPKTMLSLAIEYAEAGYHIFPCQPNGKEPLGSLAPHGVLDATTDPGTIRAWWQQRPDANIGCSPDLSGHFVLDIDIKKGTNGLETLGDLELEHGEDATSGRRVATPSGGIHLWFRGRAPTTAGKLGPGLDTRGERGYVLLPGSKLPKGEYVYLENSAPREAPKWLADKLVVTKRKEKALTDEEDTPLQIAEAARYLSLHKPVPRGNRGATAYRHACQLRDFGLSLETSYNLISRWEQIGGHPQEDQELRTCIKHAYCYAQNEQGSKAPVPASEKFAHVQIERPTRKETRISRFRPWSLAELAQRPEPRWLVKDWFLEAGTALLYGPFASYKSFVALDLALAVASGEPFLGMRTPVLGKPVVYAAGEGVHGLAKKRAPAWLHAKSCQINPPFFATDAVPQASPADLQEFVDAVQGAGLKPAIVILDTAARMLTGLDENSAQDVGNLVEAMDTLARIFSPCLILTLHHSGKDASRGARGSTALSAGVDTVVEVSADKASKTAVLTMRKQKDAEEPGPLHIRGTPCKDSLVFQPMSNAEVADLERDNEPLSPAVVGAALKAMGATGEGVTTNALAEQLAQTVLGNADPRELARMLNLRAKDKLRIYRPWGKWSVPVAD